jgi:hypothetical protein
MTHAENIAACIAASQKRFEQRDQVKLRDLSDERRAAKTWLPQSDKDVSEGRVTMRRVLAPSDGKGHTWYASYPHCAKHGAMHRLTTQANLWRCSECGVGCEVVEEIPS